MLALVTVSPATVTRDGNVSPTKAGVLPSPILTIESSDFKVTLIPETETRLSATILTNHNDYPQPIYPFHCPLPNHFSNAETNTQTQSGGVEGGSAHVHAADTLLPAQEVMQAEPCFPTIFTPTKSTQNPLL